MSAPVRVLVVDDEPLARAGVVQLLATDTEIAVVGEAADGRAALEAIRSLQPDLLILDVQMPELDGFEVLRALPRDRMPAVIFVTAYDQHALRAFEVHALDYLLKPFDDERFADALARAKQTLRSSELGELSRRLVGLLEDRGTPAPADPRLTRLIVKHEGSVAFVRVEDLDWIEAADYYVKLHTHGQVHLLRESLTALEARLDPARFFRVHRSAIVNLDRIRELQPYFKGEHILLLQDGTRLKLSRARRENLEARLGQTL
jgi:two-component system, LytTR family, response regulator